MPTETVAVVFTDLVGSTELLTQLGPERTEELRREHFALARTAVTDAGGREVKNLGDGLMAVFAVPTGALDAAVALQQRLEVRNRRAVDVLEIRVGVSVGEADTDEGDYFGTPVVEAARLCAAARGGQILATEVVRALVGSRGNHRFESLGARELKGLDTPVPVCDVGWLPLSPADAVGVPLPARLMRPEGAPFVGRDAQLTVLTQALKEAFASARCQLVLLSGEPGIGKSTLLAEFAAMAQNQGAIVLYGRCDEDLSMPYQPWREVFAHVEDHLPAVLEGSREALTVLLKGGGSDASARDPDSARYVLYAAAVDSLARASAAAPVVVLLEDLHWADAPTLALVRHLAQSTTELRVVVAASFREAEIDVAHPLANLLAALHREQGVERLALRGFDDVELLGLLETLAGHEMDEQGVALRDALRAETDGNPFFVTEILRHLAETGAITQGDDDQWVATTDLRSQGLPVSVREVIGLRVARLGPECRRAVRNAAVIGRDFELGLLAELLETDDDTAYQLLLPATEAAVVADVAPGRFSFTHALIGHALYDELAPTARARAHHDLAVALERRLGDDAGARSAELAHHWALATTHRDAHKAANYARQAGDYALAQLAPDEAALWYQRALDLVDHADDHGRCELLVGLGDAQRQAGNPAYRLTLLDACGRAILLEAPDLMVRGALANNRGVISEFGSVDEERVTMLRAAIAVRPQGLEGALLHGALATELLDVDLDESRRVANAALDLARAAGDDRTFAVVAASVMPVLRCPSTLVRRRQIIAEAEAAAERTKDQSLCAKVAFADHAVALESADLAEAARNLAMAIPYARKVPEPWPRWSAILCQSVRHFVAGDLVGSEALAEQAMEYGSAAGQANVFSFYAAQLFEIRRAQGRLDEVIEVLEGAVVETPGLPAYRAGLAAAFCDLDRPDDAAGVLEADLSDHFASYPNDITWATAILFSAEVCHYLGRGEAAASLADQLEPWRDQVAYTNITCGGSLARGLGIALATIGHQDRATEALEQAIDVNQQLQAPILVARAELDLAHTLRHADPARARQLAMSATATADRLGMLRIAKRSRQVLDELS